MGRYFGVILALSIVLSGAAVADEATDKARQLSASAKINYNIGQYAAALREYLEAYRLKPDPSLLFNLGQSARQAHRYPEAARFYRSYLREKTDLKPAEREQLEKRVSEMDRAAADELARQPPTGTQSEPATPKTAEPAATQPALTVAAPAPKSTRHPWYKKKGAISATVIGLVGIAVGAVLMGQSASNDDAARRATPLDEQRRLWADGGTYQTAGIAVLAVGGAGLLAGGVLFAIER